MYNPIIYCCLNQRWVPCSPQEIMWCQNTTFFFLSLQVSCRFPSRLCVVSLHQSVWWGQDGAAAHAHLQGHHVAQPLQRERTHQNKPRLWCKQHGERCKSARSSCGEEAGRYDVTLTPEARRHHLAAATTDRHHQAHWGEEPWAGGKGTDVQPWKKLFISDHLPFFFFFKDSVNDCNIYPGIWKESMKILGW